MSFLTALGGIGQGINQGIKNMQEQDQLKFQKEQQDRMRQSWADQDATNAALKGIQTTTPGAGANGSPIWADDNGNVMPGATAPVTRPTQDILSEQARVYLNSTDPKNKALGLQLANQATQLQKQEQQQAVLNKYKNHFDQIGTPEGAFSYLDKQGIPAYNGQVPDGYKVSQGEVLANGTRVYNVLDKNNKLVESHAVPPDQAQELAAKHITGLASHELGFITPENFQNFLKNKLEERKVGASETTAKAAQTNAETQANFHKEGGIYQQIENAKNQTQLRIAKMQQETHGMLNPLQEQELSELKSFSDLTNKFQKQLDDPNTPKKDLEKTANQLAVHPSGKALNTVMVHDTETGTTSPVTVNKFQHLVDQHQVGKAPEAAKEAIQSGKMIDPVTKKQRPITMADVEAYNKTFPNSKIDPSTLPYLKTN